MGLGLTPDLGPGLNLNPNHNLDQSLGHRQNPQTNFANLERALKKALRRQCPPTYRTSPRAHIKLPATADLSSIQKTGAPGPAPEFREFGARVACFAYGNGDWAHGGTEVGREPLLIFWTEESLARAACLARGDCYALCASYSRYAGAAPGAGFFCAKERFGVSGSSLWVYSGHLVALGRTRHAPILYEGKG